MTASKSGLSSSVYFEVTVAEKPKTVTVTNLPGSSTPIIKLPATKATFDIIKELYFNYLNTIDFTVNVTIDPLGRYSNSTPVHFEAPEFQGNPFTVRLQGLDGIDFIRSKINKTMLSIDCFKEKMLPSDSRTYPFNLTLNDTMSKANSTMQMLLRVNVALTNWTEASNTTAGQIDFFNGTANFTKENSSEILRMQFGDMVMPVVPVRSKVILLPLQRVGEVMSL